MGVLNQPIPFWLQWVGLIATLLATGLTVWAAMSARRAADAATAARDAVLRQRDTLELSDLLQDLAELYSFLKLGDYDGLSARAGIIQGRIVRHKSLRYNQDTAVAAVLDQAREQLENIRRVAVQWTGKAENQPGRINQAIAVAYTLISEVLATRQDV
jgi:hypothetical protein